MKLSDFDFELPERLIALRPAKPRPASRLLVAQNGVFDDQHFFDLPKYLRAGDRLILNDTKVIPARISGMRWRLSDQGETFAKIDVTLLSLDGQVKQSYFRLTFALKYKAKALKASNCAFHDLVRNLMRNLRDWVKCPCRLTLRQNGQRMCTMSMTIKPFSQSTLARLQPPQRRCILIDPYWMD